MLLVKEPKERFVIIRDHVKQNVHHFTLGVNKEISKGAEETPVLANADLVFVVSPTKVLVGD